jgi:hypothetical protein
LAFDLRKYCPIHLDSAYLKLKAIFKSIYLEEANLKASRNLLIFLCRTLIQSLSLMSFHISNHLKIRAMSYKFDCMQVLSLVDFRNPSKK